MDDSYSEIGTLLKRAREQQGIDLHGAAQALHVRLRYVQALEEGNLDEMPGVAYTRGYLQAYTTMLGLDRDEILRRFEAVEAMLGRRGFFLPQVFRKEKYPAPIFVWGGILLALMLYLFWLIVLQPTRLPISVVEAFPHSEAEKTHISASVAQDVACLKETEALYPPCTAATFPGLGLGGRQGQPTTVMELAK